MHIYFIREGDQGPIKIGTAKDAERRMSALQAGNKMLLHLLLTIPGGRAEEAALHRLFRDLRIERSEWFQPAERLLWFIEGLRYAAAVPDVPGRQAAPLAPARRRCPARSRLRN